ncbi:uncharacterized protein LOC134222861 [Armigeres subalbatus]|uniref:uncharacterized protein LOC134222861 n=1 Tax=Armigeres subalbatus TaxID=124917 RepID=UPI002ED3B59E
MASSPSKNEQCLFCSMSESMSEDVDWVQCGKCKQWAHFSCAGVDQEVVETNWRCQKCVSASAQLLKVPDTRSKTRGGKKTGQKDDGGSDQGVGSDADPIEKQLEEEQLAKEKAFANQMEARKKLLARQKAWKEEQLRQEREMQEMELQVQREMEERHLEHEQKMLDAQLAAEKEFVKKRAVIRNQFEESVRRVNALKDQDCAVGGTKEEQPKRKVEKWLDGHIKRAAEQHSAMDFREAYPKDTDPLSARAGLSRVSDKPKLAKKVPMLVECRDESDIESETSEESGDQVKNSRSRYSKVRSSQGSHGPGQEIGHISKRQLAARKAVSQHLPKFRGEPDVWPLFISSFEHTTSACGFSNLENLKRLQDCLQGDALEAVRSRLVLPNSVPDVISDLRNLFGRPEKLLKTLLTKVRNAPVPNAQRLESFISFGIVVKQLCDHLEAAHLDDHLNNPMLVQELVDKLPPSYKLDWVRYKRGKVDRPLRMFTNFMNEIVSDVSEVTEFSTLSIKEHMRYEKEKPRKEFVHVHGSEQEKSGNIISRFESGSRDVEMMISAKGSKERFSLSNTRTVSELQLLEQNVRYTDVVKRYTHLTGVPVKDHSPGLPTILVGLDNLHLFAPLESRVGRSNEPIAVRSKLGWTIYGYGEKRSGVQTRLNLNSVKLVGQTESQYMTLRKPNSSNRQAWVHTNTGKNKQTTAKQTIMEVGDSNPEPEVAFGQSYGPGNVRATLPGRRYAATNVWPIRHADKRQLITDRYGSD